MSEQLINHLFEISLSWADKEGLYFDATTEIIFKSFIRRGVDNLSDPDSDRSKQTAEDTLYDFVQLLIQNSRSLKIDKIIDSSVFDVSIRGFCPRFPFC